MPVGIWPKANARQNMTTAKFRDRNLKIVGLDQPPFLSGAIFQESIYAGCNPSVIDEVLRVEKYNSQSCVPRFCAI